MSDRKIKEGKEGRGSDSVSICNSVRFRNDYSAQIRRRAKRKDGDETWRRTSGQSDYISALPLPFIN